MRPTTNQIQVGIALLRGPRSVATAKTELSITEVLALEKELGLKLDRIDPAQIVQAAHVWTGPRSGEEFHFSYQAFCAPKLREEMPDEIEYLILRRPGTGQFDCRLLPGLLSCPDLDRLEEDDHEEVIDEIISHCIREVFLDEIGTIRRLEFPVFDRPTALRLRDYSKFCLHTLGGYFNNERRVLVGMQDRQNEGFALLQFTKNGEDSVFID